MEGTINGHDPRLTELFQSSLGPANYPTKNTAPQSSSVNALGRKALLRSKLGNPQRLRTGILTDIPSDSPSPSPPAIPQSVRAPRSRKRKRQEDVTNLEELHLLRLVREEEKQRKSGKNVLVEALESSGSGSPSSTIDGEDTTPPGVADPEGRTVDFNQETDGTAHSKEKAEYLGPVGDEDLDKSCRTVFLGNVSTIAVRSKIAKKALLRHLTSFAPKASDNGPECALESLRFRSTPYIGGRLPRKAAFVSRAIMDSTTQTTHAYAVYSTREAARDAVKHLNGSVVLDRHIRVDSIAHPSMHDHRRCVFIGNLGFVDDESAMKDAENSPGTKRARKTKQPADYEEGLWRTFGQIGVIESVRLVRDKTTQVGKGFAYVQFEDANAVEKALLYNNKRFPPMLPRNLRVMRARRQGKPVDRHKSKAQASRIRPVTGSGYTQSRTLAGRATKLFGRAGAAQLKAEQSQSFNKSRASSSSSLVFEGQRAKPGLSTKAKQKHSKPHDRKSKRAADFKRRKQLSKT